MDSGSDEDIIFEEASREPEAAAPPVAEDQGDRQPTRLEDMQTVQEVLQSWEESYETAGYNPAAHLTRLSEILESEFTKYIQADPDPFDDRHPLKTHPNCNFGHSLKQIFKKELLINRIVHDYLRENWGEITTEVNVAACRLFINLLPGLETNVIYQETEGLLNRLFTWAETAPEPLQSYSLGLLGASMEIPDVAAKFKDKNSQLVPLMLKRLKDIQDKMLEETSGARPFARFDKSAAPGDSSQFLSPNSNFIAPLREVNRGKSGKHRPGMKRKFEDIDNDSSSSWAELEPNIIGTIQIFPVDSTSRQIFTLRYLTPLGEYQEMLTFTLNANSISLILFNLENGNSRLQFETLKYLAALLCHKKFTSEFLTEDNLRLLLSIPRPSMSATGLSLVLYYLVYEADSIMKLNQFNPQVLKSLVNYVNWLLDCGHQSGRNHALMFYTSTYSYKFILDLFDSSDGLRRVLNIASMSTIDFEKVDEAEANMKKQAIKQVCINLKKYFESEESLKPRRLSSAIDKLLRLGGVKLLLNICELDTMGSTLVQIFDTLTLICHHGRAQLHIDEKLNIVLQGVEGELVAEAEVQKSCLRLLAKLLSEGSQNLHMLQESTRTNNGLLILTRLLFVKVPVTDADTIRTLASDCLIGLTHDNNQMKQIVHNLSIVQNGTLKLLANEPILDQSTDHARFKVNIEKLTTGDFVKQCTVISYDKAELLQLVHEFCKVNGLPETAEKLKVEAKLSDNNFKSNGSVSLDSIVKDYLQGQHNNCQYPMSIVPKFSLGKVHKCPSIVPKVVNRNFVSKLFDFRTKEYGRKIQDHRIVYSKFKPVRTFRLENADECYSSCTFSAPVNQWLLAGTQTGDVKLYNLANGEEQATYSVHDADVTHLQLNESNSLLLTSSAWRKPLSSLWRMDRPVIEKQMDFPDDEYIELSKVSQHLVIATNAHSCSIYDIETSKKLIGFSPEQSNMYSRNRATFSMDDKLILCDGVLYDYEGNTSIYKFDKLNDHVNGVFSPNGLEIISNSDVWDIRTFKLLKSVKLLDQKHVTFSDKVLYGLKAGIDNDYDSCFVTLDSSDYSSISTIDLKKPLIHLSTSWNFLQLGIVERHEDDSCVKIYDVGRMKDEEDAEEDESDEEEADDDDDLGDDGDIVELIDHLEGFGNASDASISLSGSSDSDGDSSDDSVDDEDNSEEEVYVF